MARAGQRDHIRRSVDMSVPPEQRRRKKRQGAGKRKAVPAQMAHGSSPKAQRKRREGEKKLSRERRARKG
jgi:hypothetical protein